MDTLFKKGLALYERYLQISYPTENRFRFSALQTMREQKPNHYNIHFIHYHSISIPFSNEMLHGNLVSDGPCFSVIKSLIQGCSQNFKKTFCDETSSLCSAWDCCRAPMWPAGNITFPPVLGFRAVRMFAPPGLHPWVVYLCHHSAGGGYCSRESPPTAEKADRQLSRGGFYTAVNTKNNSETERELGTNIKKDSFQLRYILMLQSFSQHRTSTF